MKEKSITELRDEKQQLRQQNMDIIAKAKAEESRAISDDELKTMQDNKLRMAEIDLLIDQKLDESRSYHFQKKPERGFSLQKALRSIVTGHAMEDVEARMCERGAELQGGFDVEKDSILVPFNTRAAVTAGAASTYGGVTTEDTAVLLPLENNLVLAQAGATIMTGLRGNVRIPAMSAVTVNWEGETDTTADGGSAPTTAKSFTPHRISAYVDISKQLLIQENQSFEDIIRKLIASAIAQKLESTALGTGHGSDAPDGAFYDPINASTPYINKGTFSWAEVVNLETEVNSNAGLKNNLAYIIHPKLWGKAKTVAKEATTGAGGLIINAENPLLNGYKVFNTANIASGMNTAAAGSTATTDGYGAMFGNFEDYHMLSWGALDITVDHLTQATAGKIRFVVNSYWDLGVVRRNSFAFGALKLS